MEYISSGGKKRKHSFNKIQPMLREHFYFQVLLASANRFLQVLR
jgi:hypothetical protein